VEILMPLIDTVPTTRVVLPSVCSTFENGKAPAALLRNFDGKSPMLILPSYGMQALHLQAAADGIDCSTTGRYRTYARQEALFRERYTTTVLPNRPYKWWDGNGDGTKERWYQKPGTAMAATPGTSNHGYGCADDVAEQLDADPEPEGMSDRLLIWMRENAPSFGFGLETRSERWHWHWLMGDHLPVRASAVLWAHGVTIDLPGYGPPPTTPPEEDDDDMKTTIITRKSTGSIRVLWPWGRTWISADDFKALMDTGQYVSAVLDDVTFDRITDVNTEMNTVSPPAADPFDVKIV
jgi:hypothetical protein